MTPGGQEEWPDLDELAELAYRDRRRHLERQAPARTLADTWKDLKREARALLLRPAVRQAQREYEAQRFKRHNERPVEFAFTFKAIGACAPRTILDVGTGLTALPHLMRNCGPVVTAIDNVTDYWPKGMVNRHWHVLDDDIRRPTLAGSFDMVTCISTLEHIDPAIVAVQSMLDRLVPGGHLVLTCPYTERSYVPNVYALPGSRGHSNPYPAQSFSRADVSGWLEGQAAIVSQEYWRYWTGEHWTEGAATIPPTAAEAQDPHQLTCLLIRKRD